VALFEIGPIYLSDQPEGQRTIVTGLISPRSPRHWGPATEDALFAMKGDLMEVLEAIGAPVGALQLVQGSNRDWWHPGRSARLQLGPKTVMAEFGALHPGVLSRLDAEAPMLGFEIILDAVPEPKSKAGATKAKGPADLPRLMPLTRDFAFVVAEDRQVGDLVRAVSGADRTLIASVCVFDVYRGPGVEDGFKSVALEVTLQPRDVTLTDADIEGLSDRVVAAADKLGARLRR